MKLSGVIFGSDDYCADLQIGRTFDATELLYARQKIVTTTSAYNMQAIDMVYIDFKGNCYDLSYLVFLSIKITNKTL